MKKLMDYTLGCCMVALVVSITAIVCKFCWAIVLGGCS